MSLNSNSSQDASPQETLINVESRKFDGRLHRSWSARIVRQDEHLLVLDGIFEKEVAHALLGKIVCGTRSVEYYWMKRCYSVFRFQEPSGELRNFYCNINLPPVLDGRTLSFIDLDIDILVMPDFTYRILDMDEFELNSKQFGYPKDILVRAHRALDELIQIVESRHFPFDRKIDET